MTEELKIPQKLHSSMIGPGGKLILSITAECGDVNIRFPQDNTTSDIITIRGTQEDVEKAKVSLKIYRFPAFCQMLNTVFMCNMVFGISLQYFFYIILGTIEETCRRAS